MEIDENLKSPVFIFMAHEIALLDGVGALAPSVSRHGPLLLWPTEIEFARGDDLCQASFGDKKCSRHLRNACSET